MTNYRRGTEKERQAMKELERVGYTAMRTAGSHGPFDVIAVAPQGIRLIQIGRVKKGNSYTGKLREAIEEIQDIPTPTGASKEVWIWRDHKGWVEQVTIS